MISRIGYVKVSARIERNAPRVVELARAQARLSENFEALVSGVEDLDSAVAKFADVLPAFAVHAHVVRITQFAWPASGLAVTLLPTTLWRKELNAMVA